PRCARLPRSLEDASSRHCRTMVTMRGSVASLATAKMVRDHPGHATGDPLAGGDVEKLVGAVRVRMRTKHARDQELRLRKALAQHVGERDRATFAHVCRRLAEISLRRFLKRSLEPRRERRRIPAARRPVALEANVRAV